MLILLEEKKKRWRKSDGLGKRFEENLCLLFCVTPHVLHLLPQAHRGCVKAGRWEKGTERFAHGSSLPLILSLCSCFLVHAAITALVFGTGSSPAKVHLSIQNIWKSLIKELFLITASPWLKSYSSSSTHSSLRKAVLKQLFKKGDIFFIINSSKIQHLLPRSFILWTCASMRFLIGNLSKIPWNTLLTISRGNSVSQMQSNFAFNVRNTWQVLCPAKNDDKAGSMEDSPQTVDLSFPLFVASFEVLLETCSMTGASEVVHYPQPPKGILSLKQ